MSAATSIPPAPSTVRTVWLVASREVLMRLRSAAFLVSTGILFAIVIIGIIAGAVSSANPSLPKVAVVDDALIQVVSPDAENGGTPAVEAVDAASLDDAKRMVLDGDVTAAVVPDDSTPAGIRIIADDEVPLDLVQLLSIPPNVELLNPGTQDPFLAYLVAIGFGIAFFAAATTFGSAIAQSVTEEKQTRVIEILLASIPTRALLAGKILGSSLLAFAQIGLLAAIGILGLVGTGQTALLGVLGPPVVWFVVFFVFGFVLLAALFAATAAMVSRQEDLASTTMPVTMLVMIPYFLVIFFNSNDLVIGIMSYVPFSAPVAMPLRIFLGTAAWWEPILSLGVLAATTLGVIWLGARIYDNSLLRLGARVKWREAILG